MSTTTNDFTTSALKTIEYDRETGDFAYYYGGEFLGFAANYGDAERKLDAHAYSHLTHQPSSVQDVAEELSLAAAEAGDSRNQRALDKAAFHLAQGLQLVNAGSSWLIPSGTRGGVIHRFSERYGCTCEAGQAQKPCWHASAVEIITTTEQRRAA